MTFYGCKFLRYPTIPGKSLRLCLALQGSARPSQLFYLSRSFVHSVSRPTFPDLSPTRMEENLQILSIGDASTKRASFLKSASCVFLIPINAYRSKVQSFRIQILTCRQFFPAELRRPYYKSKMHVGQPLPSNAAVKSIVKSLNTKTVGVGTSQHLKGSASAAVPTLHPTPTTVAKHMQDDEQQPQAIILIAMCQYK
ncbi:hypothetical protein EJ08DRAFT_199097 [Tothia fuscella]|uniref:Uncharacterized protein n=1 Tax=Tothia fuscella TaxID=1048955 RepID=A0A9P4NT01_9PEZI|nr:hypothetical protein EJ08DRAFT_199097 [Tothia fuscella]